MIYLDSSAPMKRVRREDETAALPEWLGLRPEQPVVTSQLGRIEVLRAARRMGSRALAQARVVIGGFDLAPLDGAVQDVACDLDDPLPRAADALHLASAMLLAEGLTAFITYDHRLADAARAESLTVDAPGPPPNPQGY